MIDGHCDGFNPELLVLLSNCYRNEKKPIRLIEDNFYMSCNHLLTHLLNFKTWDYFYEFDLICISNLNALVKFHL